ncbi:sensor histidine kinase [Luteimonas saliphila]|uniref:sensor histidine kinase n=1 Tax=Luteimonas saliphila TaxID=2804919 RepID=UPI00192E0CC7|nr:sensor histidine kinase [Luteimonas saliphila]
MPEAQRTEPWLPDLCRLPRLGAMLGLAQLTVVVVALVPDGSRGWDVHGFLTASGYALWLALSVAALLCVSRRWLSSLPMRGGALAAVAIAVAVSGIAAAIVHGLFTSVDTADRLPSFWRFTAGSAAVVALLTALALRYFYVIDRWQAQVGAHARAEADALQARIRPHFLFNSMNMIASLLRRDPVVAERAVLDLSDLFRAALGAGEGQSSLAEELDLSERYLGIEQLRMGDRLQVQWRKHEPLPMDLPMPRLVLQPLLENAVLHGISRLPRGGTIEIDIAADASSLTMRVRNPSLPPEQIGVHGAGHAQRSIGHRLGYMFGPRARMVSGWNDGYYACEIKLPLERTPT